MQLADLKTVPIGAVLPDPANLRDTISSEHVAALSDSIQANGFDPAHAVQVYEADRGHWARQVQLIPPEDLEGRSRELADFVDGGAAQVRELAKRGDQAPWARQQDAFGGKLYVVLDGEHRLRAARRAGLREIPIRVIDRPTGVDLVRRQLAANLARPASERELLQGLLRLKAASEPAESVKRALGKNATWFEPRWKLAGLLPDQVLMHVGRSLSVADAERLAEIYELQATGKIKELDSREAADRVVRGMLDDYLGALERDGRRPVGMIEAKIEEWRRQVGQQWLIADSLVPDESRLIERETGRAITNFNGALSALSAALDANWRRWRAEHPSDTFERFMRASGLSRHTNVSQLLDVLDLGRHQTHEIIQAICNDGVDHAACDLELKVDMGLEIVSIELPRSLQRPNTKEPTMKKPKRSPRLWRSRQQYKSAQAAWAAIALAEGLKLDQVEPDHTPKSWRWRLKKAKAARARPRSAAKRAHSNARKPPSNRFRVKAIKTFDGKTLYRTEEIVGVHKGSPLVIEHPDLYSTREAAEAEVARLWKTVGATGGKRPATGKRKPRVFDPVTRGWKPQGRKIRYVGRVLKTGVVSHAGRYCIRDGGERELYVVGDALIIVKRKLPDEVDVGDLTITSTPNKLTSIGYRWDGTDWHHPFEKGRRIWKTRIGGQVAEVVLGIRYHAVRGFLN